MPLADSRFSGDYWRRGATQILAIAGNFFGAVGPHAATQRFTYTVPANKSAMLEDAELILTRITAAGTPADFDAWLELGPPAARVMLQAHMSLVFNAIKDRIAQALSAGPMPMLTGQTLTANTINLGAVGGSVDAELHLGIKEFNG